MDEASLYNCLEIATIELGFDCFLYHGSDYEGFTDKRITQITNYPAAFFTPQMKAAGFELDPTFIACKHRGEAVVWSKALYLNDVVFVEAAQAAGLTVGWGLTVMHSPSRLAFFEVARSKRSLSPSEQASKIQVFRALADAFEHKMFDLKRASAKLLAKAGVSNQIQLCPLSVRELEILRWTADGKTAEEVSLALDLSTRTVTFHLTNIMQILKVANKTAAVSYAQMQGWLY